MDLKNYIQIYDDVLDYNMCKNAIELFKKDEENVIHLESPQMSSLNMTILSEEKKHPQWSIIHNQLIGAIQACGQQYAIDMKMDKLWPQENNLEQIKMHKYSAADGDRFNTHIDVGNHESARRFAAFFMYMNDVEEGGETFFEQLDYKVTAKCGRIVMFPPMWLFPHAGLPPVSNDKYIVTTYLHYT
tara:strand:+ start:2180 stop:2740 length:561 start_codon:yes stop_codon:yes gene_type:complete